jgi:hypothetical protein
LPIRDIAVTSSAHCAQNFAADLQLATLTIAENASGSRNYRYAQSTHRAWNSIHSGIYSSSGPGGSRHFRNYFFASGTILQVDPQQALLVVLYTFEIQDIPFILEDLTYALADL